MANAKKCDRCGMYYPWENSGVAYPRVDTRAYTLDLCSYCRSALKKFMNEFGQCEFDDDGDITKED